MLISSDLLKGGGSGQIARSHEVGRYSTDGANLLHFHAAHDAAGSHSWLLHFLGRALRTQSQAASARLVPLSKPAKSPCSHYMVAGVNTFIGYLKGC